MMHAAIIRVLFIVVFVITLPENTLNPTFSHSGVVKRGRYILFRKFKFAHEKTREPLPLSSSRGG
jgi:hypothetical protein